MFMDIRITKKATALRVALCNPQEAWRQVQIWLKRQLLTSITAKRMVWIFSSRLNRRVRTKTCKIKIIIRIKITFWDPGTMTHFKQQSSKWVLLKSFNQRINRETNSRQSMLECYKAKTKISSLLCNYHQCTITHFNKWRALMSHDASFLIHRVILRTVWKWTQACVRS